jgi:CelD/BcsL family acetyltransferase involved in cellulose biosynthesis
MHAPRSNAYRAGWCGLADLAPLADEIRALSARAAEPNVFYEPSFMLAVAPVFGAGAGAMLVRSATGRLTGLFPARIERPQGGLMPMLCGFTHPFGPLGVPLIDRDAPEAVVGAWLDRLAGDQAMPALLLMPFVPEQGAFARALDTVLSQTDRASVAFGPHTRALLDPGAERDGYIERAVSAGRRKEMRRQRRRLEEFGPVSFDTVMDADGIAAALQDFLVLEASGWKGVAGSAIVDEPAVKTFVQAAVSSLAAEGHARIDRMSLDGRPIAATVTLKSGDTAWCWKIGYNESMARFSPGVQLICELTEKLATDQRVARTDSCATADHPMINHIWRERLSLSDRLIALKPSAMPFSLACGLESLRRYGIATAKDLRDRIRRR